MATTTVLKFMQQTAEDHSLQEQLENLLGVGDGNISSANELDAEESVALNQRAPSVTEFAAAQGYQFSQDELLTVVTAFQQHQQGHLSDAEFAKVVGIGSDTSLQEPAKHTLKRLAGYLSKTYLGIDLN